MTGTVKSDEDILKALTEAARDEFASDPRWEKLSKGTLSEREEQELRALAEHFDAAALFDACKPSTKKDRERLYKPILERPSHTSPQPQQRNKAPLPLVPPKGQPRTSLPAHVQPLRRLAPYIAVGLAAAAAGLLYWTRTRETPIALVPVPEFVLDPMHGDAENRALSPSDPGLPHFGQDSSFNLVFRPKDAVEGTLETRSVLLQGDDVRAWNPGVSFQPNGLGRITGKVSELFYEVPSGQWQICLLVGRPEALPTQPADIAKKCRSPEPQPRSYWPLQQDIILRHSSATPTNQLAPRLVVETNGCQSVRTGPICTIPKSRKINLWIRGGQGGELHLSLDKQAVTNTRTPSGGGFFVPLELRNGVQKLFVNETAGDKVIETFELGFEESEEIPALEAAEAARNRNDYAGASSKLDLLTKNTAPFVRSQVLRMQARIARDMGDPDRAISLFNTSIPLDRADGRVSDEIDDRLALVFALLMYSTARQDRFAEARHALEGIDVLATQSPEGHAMIPYFRGLVALETGDFVGALELLSKAYRDAERVHRDDLKPYIALSLADTLATLGRFGESRAKLQEVERELSLSPEPCTKAALLTTIGWLLRASDRSNAVDDGGEHAQENPLAVSQAALSLLQTDCPQPTSIANVLANMALMALDAGKLRDARRYLDEARKATPEPSARVENDWLLAEAQLALAMTHPAIALKLFDKASLKAQREGASEHRVSASLGRARALEALGKLTDAGDAYAQTDMLLEDKSLFIPMGSGRLSFLARYEEVARYRMSFLLRQTASDSEGRAAGLRAAVDVARKNRARVLAAMQWMDRINHLDREKRAVWEESIANYRNKRKSMDEVLAIAVDTSTRNELDVAVRNHEAEHQRLIGKLSDLLGLGGSTVESSRVSAKSTNLSPLAEGELLLVYHPTVDGWVGFAVTGEDVVAIPLQDGIDPKMVPTDLAQRLLVPFRQYIDRASRIRFAAYGSLDRVRFHAMPWNGRALIYHAPVTYGLDLPAISNQKVPGDGTPHAVIIADSMNNLSGAAKEAETIHQLLTDRGWDVTTLIGDQATHQAVADAITREDTALLHVAGHAVIRDVDGWGWQSGIPLAKGGRLTLGDVVALPHVPGLVVLSACDGDNRGLTKDKSVFTLAQAFVVGGAAEVMAAVDTVDSERARSMMTLFYEALPHDSTLDVAVLLRAAVLTAEKSATQTDWDTYRVIVP